MVRPYLSYSTESKMFLQGAIVFKITQIASTTGITGSTTNFFFILAICAPITYFQLIQNSQYLNKEIYNDIIGSYLNACLIFPKPWKVWEMQFLYLTLVSKHNSDAAVSAQFIQPKVVVNTAFQFIQTKLLAFFNND